MTNGQKPSYEELEIEVRRLRAKQKAPPSRWRSFGITVAIIVTCLALVTANVSLWANRTLLNQNGYLKVVDPLVTQPSVKQALVQGAQTGLTSSVNIPDLISSLLPPQASFLSGPIASQVNGAIQSALTAAISSSAFQSAWQTVNDKAHERLINELSSYKGNGQIQLSDLYESLGQAVQNPSLKNLLSHPLPPKFGDIQIINVGWLPTAHRAVVATQWAPTIAFLVAIVAFGLAVFWSKNIRRTIIQTAAAIVLTLSLATVSVRVFRDVALSNFHNPTNKAAAVTIWHAFLWPLFTQTIIWISVAVIVAVITFISSAQAAKFRIGFRTAMAFISRSTGNLGATSRVVVWLKTKRRIVEWSLVAVTTLVLLVLSPLSLAALIWAVGILIVLIGVIEIFSSETAIKTT